MNRSLLIPENLKTGIVEAMVLARLEIKFQSEEEQKVAFWNYYCKS